jgi:hypothetical protein
VRIRKATGRDASPLLGQSEVRDEQKHRHCTQIGIFTSLPLIVRGDR